MVEIGRTLRETRLREGIDIGDVEEATKIRAKFLRSLENEEWSLIGGDAYARAFLRTYSEYLGLDPAPMLESFTLQNGAPHGGPAGGLRKPLESRVPARWRAALVAGAVLALVGLVIILTGQG